MDQNDSYSWHSAPDGHTHTRTLTRAHTLIHSHTFNVDIHETCAGMRLTRVLPSLCGVAKSTVDLSKSKQASGATSGIIGRSSPTRPVADEEVQACVCVFVCACARLCVHVRVLGLCLTKNRKHAIMCRVCVCALILCFYYCAHVSGAQSVTWEGRREGGWVRGDGFRNDWHM